MINNVLHLGDKLMISTKKKQSDFKDSFEKLYLRHDYLSKINNFDGNDLKQYEPIVKSTALHMYNKFKVTYNKVGFAYEDIVSISRVYLYCYLGLYGFKNNPKEFDKFKQGFIDRKNIEPTDIDMVRGERNLIINFIRQKLNTCSTFCERKSRNIVIGKNEKKVFAHTSSSVPASDDLIMADYATFGYRVVTKKEHSSIIKSCKGSFLQDKDGFKVFQIDILSQIPLSFNGIISENEETSLDDFLHDFSTNSVENQIITFEEDVEFDVYKMNFENLETSKRKLLLNKFIKTNNNNKHLKEELYTARKMLKNMKNVV
jgi:hypothetical protein